MKTFSAIDGKPVDRADESAILDVELGIHDYLKVQIQRIGGFLLLGNLDSYTFPQPFSTHRPIIVEIVFVNRPEVKPHSILAGQKLSHDLSFVTTVTSRYCLLQVEKKTSVPRPKSAKLAYLDSRVD